MTAAQRSIVHFDLDSFFVSCERLQDTRLEGKPILVGGTGDRGVVSSASYEARQFGASSGMPMRMAKKLCPEAIVIRGDASLYMKHSNTVTQILKEKSPILEKASVDEFYIDMTGMEKYFGCFHYAKELRQTVMKETGLPISFGLSSNKTVAKVATGEAKPNNQLMIDFGQEKQFLAPLSVKKIPLVGTKSYQLFYNMGIKKVSTIQQMPMEMMESVFGKNGKTIWERANGIDLRPLVEYHERKSISSERTFGQDTTDISVLKTTIKAMAENLAFQLRKAGKVTGSISLKLRYSDYSTYTKQKKLNYTSADDKLIETVDGLFEALYNRRMLVRLVGVRFSDLAQGHHQMDMFADCEKKIKLYQAMDAIRQKYGDRAVMRLSTMGAKTIGRGSNPFDGEPPIVLAHRNQ